MAYLTELWIGERVVLSETSQVLAHLAQCVDVPKVLRDKCAKTYLDVMAIVCDLATVGDEDEARA